MSIDKILLIVLLVAVIAIAAVLILGPIISDLRDGISQKTDLGDVAVTAAGEYLVAQMTQAAYTPTPGAPPLSAAELAATAAADERSLNATQEAEQRLAEAYTQATAQAKTEAEESARTTSTAEWAAIYWIATSTAAYEQTQIAYPPTQTAAVMTMTAYPLVATTDAQRLIAQGQIIQAQADNLARKVAQEKWTSVLWNIVLPVVIVAGLALVWFYIKEMKRVRKLNQDGTLNAVEDEQGTLHVTNADNMPGPSMKIHSTGVKLEGDAPYQEKITTQAQKVKAVAAAAGAQSPAQAFNVATDLMTGTEVRYDISASPSTNLDPETGKALDLAWENKL